MEFGQAYGLNVYDFLQLTRPNLKLKRSSGCLGVDVDQLQDDRVKSPEQKICEENLTFDDEIDVSLIEDKEDIAPTWEQASAPISSSNAWEGGWNNLVGGGTHGGWNNSNGGNNASHSEEGAHGGWDNAIGGSNVPPSEEGACGGWDNAIDNNIFQSRGDTSSNWGGESNAVKTVCDVGWGGQQGSGIERDTENLWSGDKSSKQSKKSSSDVHEISKTWEGGWDNAIDNDASQTENCPNSNWGEESNMWSGDKSSTRSKKSFGSSTDVHENPKTWEGGWDKAISNDASQAEEWPNSNWGEESNAVSTACDVGWGSQQGSSMESGKENAWKGDKSSKSLKKSFGSSFNAVTNSKKWEGGWNKAVNNNAYQSENHPNSNWQGNSHNVKGWGSQSSSNAAWSNRNKSSNPSKGASFSSGAADARPKNWGRRGDTPTDDDAFQNEERPHPNWEEKSTTWDAGWGKRSSNTPWSNRNSSFNSSQKTSFPSSAADVMPTNWGRGRDTPADDNAVQNEESTHPNWEEKSNTVSTGCDVGWGGQQSSVVERGVGKTWSDGNWTPEPSNKASDSFAAVDASPAGSDAWQREEGNANWKVVPTVADITSDGGWGSNRSSVQDDWSTKMSVSPCTQHNGSDFQSWDSTKNVQSKELDAEKTPASWDDRTFEQDTCSAVNETWESQNMAGETSSGWISDAWNPSSSKNTSESLAFVNHNNEHGSDKRSGKFSKAGSWNEGRHRPWNNDSTTLDGPASSAGGKWKTYNRSRSGKFEEKAGGNGIGILTATGKRMDLFTSEEEGILNDVNAVVSSVKNIIRKCSNGDRLTPEDQTYILDNVFCHHPDKVAKIGDKFDHIEVDEAESHKSSRCFYLVSSDDTRQDFSYLKCMRNYIHEKYPERAESFYKKYFHHPPEK